MYAHMHAWRVREHMRILTAEPQEVSQEAAQHPAEKLSSPKPAKPMASVEMTPQADSRGTKRVLPDPPQKDPKHQARKKDSDKAETADESEDEPPRVLLLKDMSKLEKEKVRRICSPKKGTGRLEVPENVFEMWQDAAKGRDSLFRMWCKSGGVKAGILVLRSKATESLEGYFYKFYHVISDGS